MSLRLTQKNDRLPVDFRKRSAFKFHRKRRRLRTDGFCDNDTRLVEVLLKILPEYGNGIRLSLAQECKILTGLTSYSRELYIVRECRRFRANGFYK